MARSNCQRAKDVAASFTGLATTDESERPVLAPRDTNLQPIGPCAVGSRTGRSLFVRVLHEQHKVPTDRTPPAKLAEKGVSYRSRGCEVDGILCTGA